jgi:hypothetical protein
MKEKREGEFYEPIFFPMFLSSAVMAPCVEEHNFQSESGILKSSTSKITKQPDPARSGE